METSVSGISFITLRMKIIHYSNWPVVFMKYTKEILPSEPQWWCASAEAQKTRDTEAWSGFLSLKKKKKMGVFFFLETKNQRNINVWTILFFNPKQDILRKRTPSSCLSLPWFTVRKERFDSDGSWGLGKPDLPVLVTSHLQLIPSLGECLSCFSLCFYNCHSCLLNVSLCALYCNTLLQGHTAFLYARTFHK